MKLSGVELQHRYKKAIFFIQILFYSKYNSKLHEAETELLYALVYDSSTIFL